MAAASGTKQITSIEQINKILVKWCVPVESIIELKHTEQSIPTKTSYISSMKFKHGLLNDLIDTEPIKLHITSNPKRGHYWFDLTPFCICILMIHRWNFVQHQIKQIKTHPFKPTVRELEDKSRFVADAVNPFTGFGLPSTQPHIRCKSLRKYETHLYGLFKGFSIIEFMYDVDVNHNFQGSEAIFGALSKLNCVGGISSLSSNSEKHYTTEWYFRYMPYFQQYNVWSYMKQ